jgi:hypothetical protein
MNAWRACSTLTTEALRLAIAADSHRRRTRPAWTMFPYVSLPMVVTFVGSTGNTTGADGTTSVDAPQSWNWSAQDDPNQSPDGLCSGSGTADTTGGGALLKPEGSQLGVIISMYYELGFCSLTDSLASAFVIAPTTDAPVLIAPIDGATVTTTVVTGCSGPAIPLARHIRSPFI